MILHSDISRVNKAGFASLDPLFGSVELQGVAMPFGRNAEVYGEGEPADYVYKVLAGAIRSYKILSDGRRQIVGFYLPGDVFGLSCEDEHSCSAEAVADLQVQVVRRSTLLRAAERDADVAKALWSFTAAELKRSQEHGLLLIRALRNASLLSFSIWRAGSCRRTRLISDVAVKISPTISASPSRRSRGRSPSSRI